MQSIMQAPAYTCTAHTASRAPSPLLGIHVSVHTLHEHVVAHPPASRLVDNCTQEVLLRTMQARNQPETEIAACL
jgi:hypothetical protein